MNSSAISVLAEAGFHGRETESALRHVLSELAAPSARSVEHLERLGLDADAVDTSIHRNVVVFRRLADAGVDAAGAQVLFGDAGGVAMALIERIDRLEEIDSP